MQKKDFTPKQLRLLDNLIKTAEKYFKDFELSETAKNVNLSIGDMMLRTDENGKYYYSKDFINDVSFSNSNLISFLIELKDRLNDFTSVTAESSKYDIEDKGIQ